MGTAGLVGGFAFAWRVSSGRHAVVTAEEGYFLQTHWQKEDEERLIDRGGPWLVEAAPRSASVRYFPLAERLGLHREFAELPTINREADVGPATERYRRFANRYGLLCRQADIWQEGPRSAPGGELGGLIESSTRGDSVFGWDREIRWFRSMVRIWRLVEARDTGKLGQLIAWKDAKAVVLQHDEEWIEDGAFSPPFEEEIAGPSITPELVGRWKQWDLYAPARYWLARRLNGRLVNRASPYLTDDDPPRVAFHPDSLLTAMRVMMLLEVSGQSKLRQCAGCREWFDATDSKTSREYCGSGSRCRMRALRRRQTPSAAPGAPDPGPN